MRRSLTALGMQPGCGGKKWALKSFPGRNPPTAREAFEKRSALAESKEKEDASALNSRPGSSTAML